VRPSKLDSRSRFRLTRSASDTLREITSTFGLTGSAALTVAFGWILGS
jgi:hypothetical protein